MVNELLSPAEHLKISRELARRRYKEFMATASPKQLAKIEGRPEWADDNVNAYPDKTNGELTYAKCHWRWGG